MDRRTFIGAVAATIIAAPLAAREKPATRVRRIGVLESGSPSTPYDTELVASLRALGWVEGQNLLIERRNDSSPRAELLQRMAEELVRLKVEIIVTWGTPAALAAKSATTIIPIVMASAGDPVRAGLVASLARPGGNITGFSIISPELDAKLLAVMRELVPGLRRVGLLEDSTQPIHRTWRTGFEQACRSLGLEPVIIGVAAADELEKAIAEMVRQRVQALYIQSGDLMFDNRVPLMNAALRYALPTLATDKEWVEAGALVVFNNSYAEQFQRSASFIDRILRGAKPADLPIEQPTKFELGINLKTAKALGITVPQALLQRADEVIQ